MKKRFNLVTMVVLMALMSVVTYIITQSYVQQSYNVKLTKNAEIQTELKLFLEALDYVKEEFIGDFDMNMVQEGAVRGMVENLGDRWSGFETAEEYARLNENRNNAPIVGIGIEAETVAFPRVATVMPGMPAEAAGLRPGDYITGVNGKSIPSELSYSEAIEAIGKGEIGEDLSLTIRRGTEELTVDLSRQLISTDVVRSRILESAGYVRVENFNNRADSEFIAAVDEMIAAGVTSLIVDVRNNPGGDLTVLHKMLDYLLPEGRVITLRYKDGHEEPYDSDAACVNLPVVVLANESSVSAAEFFAACLREYGRAAVVGGQTGGKGYAQMTFPLAGGSALRLSTCEYFLPSGKSLANPDPDSGAEAGLLPDHTAPFDRTAGDIMFQGRPNANPEADPQLLEALRVLGVIS